MCVPLPPPLPPPRLLPGRPSLDPQDGAYAERTRCSPEVSPSHFPSPFLTTSRTATAVARRARRRARRFGPCRARRRPRPRGSARRPCISLLVLGCKARSHSCSPFPTLGPAPRRARGTSVALAAVGAAGPAAGPDPRRPRTHAREERRREHAGPSSPAPPREAPRLGQRRSSCRLRRLPSSRKEPTVGEGARRPLRRRSRSNLGPWPTVTWETGNGVPRAAPLLRRASPQGPLSFSVGESSKVRGR